MAETWITLSAGIGAVVVEQHAGPVGSIEQRLHPLHYRPHVGADGGRVDRIADSLPIQVFHLHDLQGILRHGERPELRRKAGCLCQAEAHRSTAGLEQPLMHLQRLRRELRDRVAGARASEDCAGSCVSGSSLGTSALVEVASDCFGSSHGGSDSGASGPSGRFISAPAP